MEETGTKLLGTIEDSCYDLKVVCSLQNRSEKEDPTESRNMEHLSMWTTLQMKNLIYLMILKKINSCFD